MYLSFFLSVSWRASWSSLTYNKKELSSLLLWFENLLDKSSCTRSKGSGMARQFRWRIGRKVVNWAKRTVEFLETNNEVYRATLWFWIPRRRAKHTGPVKVFPWSFNCIGSCCACLYHNYISTTEKQSLKVLFSIGIEMLPSWSKKVQYWSVMGKNFPFLRYSVSSVLAILNDI